MATQCFNFQSGTYWRNPPAVLGVGKPLTLYIRKNDMLSRNQQ
uniref:Uncharacterized protein n=1 Tax=Anguilla anguilla TaxID=7936 RepID=A0A0E9XIK2_ANGAN